MPDNGVISPSHDIIFPFTQRLNGTFYGFLSHHSVSTFFSFCLPRSAVFLPDPSLHKCHSHCKPSLPLSHLSEPLPTSIFSQSDLKESLSALDSLPLDFPPPHPLCLLLFLSLEEKKKKKITHSSVCRVLLLTSKIARRILTKLPSQLTPRAHNNLSCQQLWLVHADTHACMLHGRERNCSKTHGEIHLDITYYKQGGSRHNIPRL